MVVYQHVLCMIRLEVVLRLQVHHVVAANRLRGLPFQGAHGHGVEFVPDLICKVGIQLPRRPSQHLPRHHRESIPGIERRGSPMRLSKRRPATAYLAAVGDVVVDEKGVVQQFNCHRNADQSVRSRAEGAAGREAQRRTQGLTRARRVLAHRTVEPSDRFTVGHSIEHRPAYHLAHIAQVAFNLGNQGRRADGAGHGSNGLTASSTGSHMSGWPSASNVPR